MPQLTVISCSQHATSISHASSFFRLVGEISYLPAADPKEETEDIRLLLLLELFDVFKGTHLFNVRSSAYIPGDIIERPYHKHCVDHVPLVLLTVDADSVDVEQKQYFVGLRHVAERRSFAQ